MGGEPAPSDRADRRVGWLISLSSLLLGVWWVPDALSQWDRFPAWWNVGGWVAVAAFLGMIASGLWMPMRVLRVLWISLPALLIVLQLLSFGVVLGDPAEVLPWIWLLESASVCLLALRLPTAAAVAVSIFSSLSVPFSAWAFTGGIPYLVMTNLPMRLANVVFIALVIGVRRRLTLLHQAEAEARTAVEHRARSAAEAEERVRFSRFVHDEVLSVLTAANLFSGAPPPELRAEAAVALRALDSERTARRAGEHASGPGPEHAAEGASEYGDQRLVDPLRASERLRTRVGRIAPAARVVVETDGSPVRSDALEALSEATAEALRNAVRHARAQRITVRVEILDGRITISIADDGIGFDASAAPPERLGVRQSIVARVSEVGGRARIVSAPGEGTEVTLAWTP